MKTGEDFRREFPAAEDGFRDAAYAALQGLHEEKEAGTMKLRPMLAIAVFLVLLMGVGVAATWERWSLDDFIPTGRITATENEWYEMIAAFEPVTAETAVANVTVREALYDGYALYIVVDVQPLSKFDFFVPEMTEMDAPAREAADALPADMTLREYVASKGYIRTLEVGMNTGLKGLRFLPEMELNEDGTMTFYLRQRIQDPDNQNGDLQMTLFVWMKHKTGSGSHYVQIPLTIRRLPVLEEAVSAEGERHEFVNHGVVMSDVRLIRTPISTYVTVAVEVVDEDAYAAHFGRFKLDFIDEDGVQYDAGPFNLAGFMQDSTGKDAAPGAPYYMATLTMTDLPATLRLIEAQWGVHDPDQAMDSWVIQLEDVQ